MDWFRRKLLKDPNSSKNSSDLSTTKKQQQHLQEELLKEYGITNELIDYVKTLTIDTFRNFPLQDDDTAQDLEAGSASNNVKKDLSEWQEQHAILMLSRVKEIAQLRYKLCPAHLKENRFWNIYFMLVRSYIAEHELRAIRQAKLKSMTLGDENSSYNDAYEVEMSETNKPASLPPQGP